MFFKDNPILLKSIEPNFPNVSILALGIHDFKYLKGINKFRKHPHVTLHYIIEGSGYLHIDGMDYHLKKNTFFMTPANTLMKYYPDTNEPWTYVWFDLKDDSKTKVFLNFLKLGTNTPYITTKLSHKILPIFNDLFKKDNKRDERLSTYTALFQIVDIVHQEQNLDKPLSYVDHAIIFIENNYHHSHLKVTDIVDAVSISQTYLNESFKKETGHSIMSYLIQYRLNMVTDLLRSPNISIHAAASMVGYDDIIHFSKTFKKHIGMTASQYRLSL